MRSREDVEKLRAEVPRRKHHGLSYEEIPGDESWGLGCVPGDPKVWGLLSQKPSEEASEEEAPTPAEAPPRASRAASLPPRSRNQRRDEEIAAVDVLVSLYQQAADMTGPAVNNMRSQLMDLICGSLAEGAGLRGSAASALAGAAIPGDQRFRIRAWGFQERRFDRSASGAPPSGGSAASSGQGPGPFDGTAASSASAPRNRPQVAPSKAAAVAPASLRPGQQESKAPPKSTGPWKQVPPWHQTINRWQAR